MDWLDPRFFWTIVVAAVTSVVTAATAWVNTKRDVTAVSKEIEVLRTQGETELARLNRINNKTEVSIAKIEDNRSFDQSKIIRLEQNVSHTHALVQEMRSEMKGVNHKLTEIMVALSVALGKDKK